MEVASGILFSMEERIRTKLIAAGAISHEKAVSAEEADLDMQEQNWIHYIAGGMFAGVKKTASNLYYVARYN
jgi:VIT1/CCC1 family predicted Fe2+/Mn2+ transporter